MLTPGEERKIDEILRLVRETTALVREIRMWRRFVAWAFAGVSLAVTIYDFWKLVRG